LQRPKHTPRSPEYARAVRESFERQRLMHTIGAEIASVEPGEIEIHLPYRIDLTQQHAFLHAGVVTAVLDSACGYAAFSLMSPGTGVLSVEFKTNLLAPARGDLLIARARVVRAGRTITVCEADAIMRSGDSDTLVATMLATMMCIQDRPEIVS
jgi:uncharacterized protein (TIGR00369 family)